VFSGGDLAWRTGGRWLAGAVLAVAAVYELTPLKDVCLGKCRSPLGFLLGAWRDGNRGALEMGTKHAAWCVGCCWALMAGLFALGVMSITWMALIAALITLEKTIPWRWPSDLGHCGSAHRSRDHGHGNTQRRPRAGDSERGAERHALDERDALIRAPHEAGADSCGPSVMAGNHTRDGLVALVSIPDSDTNVILYPQALATACVINGDLHRPHRNKLARLPRPREMTLGIATETASTPRSCDTSPPLSARSTHALGSFSLLPVAVV
jgi:Predicted metal-binding integral membrane protein (DUF2182)